MRFRNIAALLTALLVGTGAIGCAEDPPDATPEGALAELLEAMQESRYDDARRAEAFALLDSASQAELEARATRAEALGRSGLEPWEMIAIGRFRLPIEPRRMSARVDGERGVVVVAGTRGERAEVPVVREEGHWRVVLFSGESAHDGDLQAPESPADDESPSASE